MEISVIDRPDAIGATETAEPERRRDLVVACEGDPSLAELLAAAGVEVEAGVVSVDGHPVPLDVSVAAAGVRPGSVLVVGDDESPPEPKGPPDAGGPVAAVVGGLAAGLRHPLGERPAVVVGRSPAADLVLADPTVSSVHARLRRDGDGWWVEDLGSHNGTAVGVGPSGEPRTAADRSGHTAEVVDDVVMVGASSLDLRADPDDRKHRLDPAADGHTPFNRPPRLIDDPVAHPIPVPDPPAERRRAASFSLVALVGPIVMGVVMVQLFGSLRYALFALLAPVMLLTNAVATRRRNTKDARSSARRFRRELAEFSHALDVAAVDERRRRQRAVVDIVEAVRRAELRSVHVWERRPGHPDHLRVRVGTGAVPWDAPIDRQRVDAHADLQAVVAERRRLPAAPAALSLGEGSVVGIVGDRGAALAVARALLVQVGVHHGPADLAVGVVADEGRAGDWEWVKWLPHTAVGDGRLLAEGVESSNRLLDALIAAVDEADDDASLRHRPVLLVVDGDDLTTARRAPARELLLGRHGPACGIVLAASAERLPSACTTVIELVDDLGAAVLRDLRTGEVVEDLVVDGVAAETAESVARAMAPFVDPDLRRLDGELPVRVGLLALLGLARDAAGAIDRSAPAGAWWVNAGADRLAVPIGISEDGPVMLDLVQDGPHALVGGTTGSGKSEFLRSLVVGLAAGHGPDDLVFVLIDYKGGSAFDACAELPHTVGLVTDLDGHLAERALRSLDAELHRRERLLRSVGAADLAGYRAAGADEPLPRLVLVVDEFATLATELPTFMHALVGIAQRGRSLGVHMVLATQRPAGVVSADIKANTNIRVALRMQDARDSIDVIDVPDAARLGRATPGRALVRLGPGEIVRVQTALATGSTTSTGPAVRVAPFEFGPGSPPPAAAAPDHDRTDLAALVAATAAAHRASGREAPRRPWLDLPDRAVLAELLRHGADGGVPIAVADDPDNQRTHPLRWDPASGHAAFLGATGSGTTTALRTTAFALAASLPPSQCHLYALDHGGGGLADLAALAHCGAVVGAAESERRRRLLDQLVGEMARRRDGGRDDSQATIVLLVDDLPALLADHADPAGQDVVDAVRRILAEGPAVGVVVAFTADRAGAVPARLLGAVALRCLFRHADPDDVAAVGLRRAELPEFIVGRAIDATTRLVVQFPLPVGVGQVEVRAGTGGPAPMTVDALPRLVPLASVPLGSTAGSGGWVLGVGVDADSRDAARLTIRPGEGVLVAGTARSGVSTALETIARQSRALVPHAVLVAVADDRSPLRAVEPGLLDAFGSVDELAKVLEVAALDTDRSWLVLVDDAHRLESPGALEPLLGSDSHCRLVVGGRSDHLHGSFGHWTRLVRRAGTGLLLQPRLDSDGDLLGVRLPRRWTVPPSVGRGFRVDQGEVALLQLGFHGAPSAWPEGRDVA